ncbi:MAG: plasmid stabilization protein [Lentisphaerae bacterium RIFOXYB12_FULL_65_16]|nr:MAG: plasmid stabilization protein [Lentisphaerae bacterium RIFOXYA12_64_32]OGV85793.1 MAG: plasmid stabilization protein [Lentisphaerae bacterium RIFOXYB12_FULL_65_16]
MRIQWTPLAIERVTTIAHYIRQDNPAAAIRWAERVFAKVERLSSFPLSGRHVPEVARDDIREILYGNYRIIYRVAPTSIAVLTVRHGKQLLPLDERV